MSEFGDRLFVGLQHLLPQHLLSNGMYRLARSETPWIKRNLINLVRRRFDIDTSEAADSNPDNYPSFNAFFTRALRDTARPMDEAPDTLISPVDGAISQIGDIDGERIFQAKGHEYDLPTLLGGDLELARQFQDGSFATIYLSPRDYHRIHMPLDGVLRRMVFVPGRLFSVNTATTARVPGLFARNERLINLFDTPAGPMALIMVGAIFVGSMQTTWAGEVRARELTRWDYPEDQVHIARGEEMGRFNMGSTVILLLPRDTLQWDEEGHAGASVWLRRRLGALTTAT